MTTRVSWLSQALADLAREPSDDLATLISACCDDVVLTDTRTISRVHLVQRDANDEVRIDALTKLLARQVVDFCIPRSRRDEAQAHLVATGSTEEFERLSEEARSLFTTLENSGEAGELLLYMLLERMLGLPQLLCKMSLKTNPEMHVHGTDGVHARFENDGRLALYWGESKLHKSFGSAIDECVKSIAPYLIPGNKVRDHDLLLLREHVNIEDEVAIDALRRYFLSSTPQAAKVEFRAACLVGFDIADYPRPEDAALTENIEAWRARVARRIGDHRLERFEVEFFLIPFPSVSEFRDAVHGALAGA